MSLICTNVTSWITQQVLTPTNTWATQAQQQCQQLPWWNPLGWLCWIITTLILVVVWVLQNVVVPIISVVCTFVTWVIGWVVLVVATVIDAVCQKCNAVIWTNHWFHTPGKITFDSSTPSTVKPGYFDYTFTCNCSDKSSHTIIITAINDNDAASQAKLECEKTC